MKSWICLNTNNLTNTNEKNELYISNEERVSDKLIV